MRFGRLRPVLAGAKARESRLNRGDAILLSRSFISTALFFFFVLAFVAAPYWLIAESSAERIVFLLISVLLGFAWTRLAAGEVQVQPLHGLGWLQAAMLLVLVAALNFRAVTSAIPWRGDESYHISFAVNLARMMPPALAFAAIVAFLLLLYLAWRKPRLALASCAILVAGCVAVFLLREFPPLGPMARYPFVSRWFHALVPILLSPLTGLNHEILYRIVPLLSAVLLSWLYSRSVPSGYTAVTLVLGMAIATIPVVFYFSSILYLEMPSVVLMFAVCSKADKLLSLDFHDLKKNPSWYALILIGFIKETAAAFLLCFVVCRIAARLKSSARPVPWLKLARDEFLMALGTLLPLVLYMFFRSYFGDRRQYHFNPANLLNLRALGVILLSHLEQFGLSYLLFLCGIFLLFRNRQYRQAIFLLLAVVSAPLFHLIDTVRYAGYSRFNLFALPAVLAGSAVLLRFIGAKRKWYLPAIAVLIVTSNLLMSPVNLDGTKKPYWGNYIVKTPAEHYYPIPDALAWLKDNRRPEMIHFVGFSISYFFDFYYDKLDWHPRYELLKEFRADDPAFIRDTLQAALQSEADCVVFRVDARVPQLNPADGIDQLWQMKVFSNMAHSLLVYSRR